MKDGYAGWMTVLDVRPLQDASRFRGIGTALRLYLKAHSQTPGLTLLAIKGGPEFENFGLPILWFSPPRAAATSVTYGKVLSVFLRSHHGGHLHFFAQYLVPESFDFPHSATIHDLFTPYRGKNPKKDAALVAAMKSRFVHATELVAISEFVKQELVTRLDLNPARIRVDYPKFSWEGFSDHPLPEDAGLLAHCGIRGPYVLSVGDFEARKNQSGMIAAFLKMNDRMERKYTYVACIGKGVMVPPGLWIKLRASGRWKEFVFLNYIDHVQIRALYRNAALLSFVSKAEGFGLPVLEGLASGVPVLTSTTTSLPEVGQDAVAYANPESIDEMAAQMEKVLSTPTWVADHAEAARRVLTGF